MTIASQLLQVANTKSAIAAAIEAKGVTVGAALFADYAGKIGEITSGGGAAPTASGWVRPADWLALPVIASGGQVFAGLYAVLENGTNSVAILAAGNYTVDWGDGSVENVTGNVTAEHVYSYASLPVGSVSSRGYKQVVIVLTPQAGQNITKLDMQQLPSGSPAGMHNGKWLDVVVSLPSATVITISTFFSQKVSHLWLERFYGKDCGLLASSYGMFRDCQNLAEVSLLATSALKIMTRMFYGCSSLSAVPLWDTSGVTDPSYMFQNCYALQSVPLFDLSKSTNMASMFESCYSLPSIPMFNTPVVTNLSRLFQYCYSLTYVPTINTSSVTNMSYLFEYCGSLLAAPPLAASLATNMSFAFGYCYRLGSSSLVGVKVSHSYAVCNLSATALNEIFTNLATVTGQTITITNNPGAATCNRSIATAKGWTVTG